MRVRARTLLSIEVDVEVYAIERKIRLIKNISDGQTENLNEMLINKKCVLSSKVGKCTSCKHSFQVTTYIPFEQRYRPILAALFEKTDVAIRRMIVEDITESLSASIIES